MIERKGDLQGVMTTRHPATGAPPPEEATTSVLRHLARLALMVIALGLALALPAAVSADPGDLGFEGPIATGAGAAPTGSKPQAKLWFNDGSWWASMWDQGTSDFYIWKLDRTTETWTRTGTRLDDRASTRADVLWDGTHLYVASHNFSESDGSGQSRLYRYSYDTSTDTYSLDSGFPATINNVRSETLVIDKDSTGKLWATWEQGTQIWVNRTDGNDNSWNATPFVLPGSQNVSADDISSLIAFGGNKLGVYYSNQSGSPDNDSFIVHTDGQPDMTWGTRETAFSGNNFADDHVNLKTDASGKVYGVVKTSLTGSSQLIKFLQRATNGGWTNYDVATGTDSHTRPILILDQQHPSTYFRIYMTHGQSGGPIVEKTSALSPISFPTGTAVGNTVIWDASANDMNNATSTKQNVDANSGLIVMAFEDTTKHYWHADIFPGSGVDNTAPTVTTKAPADTATDVGIGTNVTATFSEAVTGVDGTTFTLTGPGNTAVTATVTYDPATKTATLDPTANLSPSALYTANLTSGIKDLSNNALAPVTWTFTTAAPDNTPPTVTSTVPADLATGVALGANVTATFSEDVVGVNGTTFTLTGPGSTPVAATVIYDVPTKTATLDPNANLAPSTTYSANLTSGITDASSNALAPVTWTFTTGAAPAGPAFVGASSAANATATTLVLPKPAGFASGDALLATVAARGAPTITPPAGWTLVRLDASGSTVRQAVYVHIAGGSEPASYTFTLSSAQSAAGGILAYTGVDPVTPIDAHGGQANVASTSITAPSITTTGANRLLAGLFGTAALTSETPPRGMTERYDQQVPGTNQYKVTTGADDQLLAGAGATGTRVALAAASGINIGQLVALNPGSGGPPPDTTPPTVTNKTPAANATNVGIATNVTATFSEDVTGVSGTTFTLEAPGPVSIPATVTYNAATRTATLDPTSNLANNVVYTATLTSGITDTSSNANALSTVTWTFTTVAADNTPPTVTNTTPADSATNVAIGSNVTATFSEDVLNVDGTTFTLQGPGTTAVTAVVTYDAPTRTATLNPSANLANNVLYTATLTSGITDTSSNALVPVTWTFTTVAGDTTPPTVTNKTPANNATNVAIGTNVTATFSEDVTGVSGTTFTLEGPGSTPVAATVTYDGPTKTATLNPNANLTNNVLYTARLTSGITDTSSNALAPVSWTFTTVVAVPSGIAFRSASSANNATATTLVIPAPTGVASGDAMLAVVSVRAAPTITPPAGWTLVRQDANASTMRQAVFVRVAGGSEPASYTFNLSSAQSAAGGIVAYSGVDGTTPVEVHGGQLNASSTSITAPSITTTGANRQIVGFFGTPVLTSMTPPGGMTERYDQTVPSTNTYKVTSGAADENVAAAGATGTRVATAANAAANIGQLVALNPAP